MKDEIRMAKDEWKSVELDKAAALNPRLPISLSGDNQVSFVPMSAVSAETSDVTEKETRSYSEVSKGYTPFVTDDVLVAKITPCFENGKIALARLQQKAGFGSTEFHVIRALPDKLEPRYLLHFMRQGWIRVAGERRMTGSGGQRRVPENFLAKLEIPLPPLAEQRRIAEVLDRAEALRAKRRAALAQLDSLTQSLFLDLFGDPVTNPKGWSRVKFGNVGTLDRGISKHRPRNEPALLGGPYPLVQTGEVSNCGGYITAFEQTYSVLGLRQSKLWPAGTLCIMIAANIAKTGILTFEACFPDSVVGFRADDPATVEFIRVWLSFLQKMLEDSAPESAQKNINLAILRDLDVPLPPIALQQEFARRVGAVEKLKQAQRAALAEQDALFATLQHRAFRGEA